MSLQIVQEIAKLNHLNYQEIAIDNFIAAQGDFLFAFFCEGLKGVVLSIDKSEGVV